MDEKSNEDEVRDTSRGSMHPPEDGTDALHDRSVKRPSPAKMEGINK